MLGLTPVHQAAASGCPKVFFEVIFAGGDLRRFDYYGNDIASKIADVSNKKKQLKMFSILEERLQMGEIFISESKGVGVKSRLR